MFNIIGHRLDDGPYVPCLYIGPTEKAVKSISKDRIDKMFASTESLKAKLEGGQRDGVFEKFVGGVRLGFAWAGSATELASHPAGLVLLDEVDRMDGNIAGEGDPVSLARARAKNYSNRKIGTFSTPTIEGGSAIWALLESAGAIYMYAWHCIHCNQPFVPQLSLLKWPEADSVEQAASQAVVACPGCGGIHETKDKGRLNAEGRYVRVRVLRDKEDVPEGERLILEQFVLHEDQDDRSARSVGFWISGLCSPWASFFDIANQLLKAYRSHDQTKIQAIINTYGGELYRLKGDAPDWQEVAANRLEYPPSVIPSRECQVITLGADVQKNGIYWCIRAWGAESESWLLDNGFTVGETEYDNVWLLFARVLMQTFNGKSIDRAFIDSGYRPGDKYRRPDHAVYRFCRNHAGLAFPTKGRDSLDASYKASDIDMTINGKLVKSGVRLYHLNTDYFKRWIHSRIRWPDDAERGGWHLHKDTEEDYCRQLVSEELVIKPSGQAVWVVRSKDNHYLDCEVGATAAAASLNVHALRPMPTVEQEIIQKAQASKPRATSSAYRRKSLF